MNGSTSINLCIYPFTIRLIIFFLSAGIPYQVSASTEIQDPIVLQVKRLLFTPTEFYIDSFTDERKNTLAVAWLIPPGDASSKSQAVDLYGGGGPAIQNFVFNSLPRNQALRPVIVRLKICEVVESPGDNGLIDGELTLHMAFDLKGEKDNYHLIDFKGGIRYKRSINKPFDVEPALRKSLGNALEHLHQWMTNNVASHILLAREVKVMFSDYVENPEKDTVFYSPDRPLIWDDFLAIPNRGKYAASVFPEFSWTGRSEVIDGVVHYHIQTKVYMLKNSSWVMQTEKNAYGLNHEQRHFDIVKIVVERFKQKLARTSLTPEDYDSMLGYQYIETYREMNKLQDKYDAETRHGINKEAQRKWNQLIDEELMEIFSK